uniref:Uncharacterized protein n=1 Tax=Arundo donax TaxID=35708 RepID=A0A0A9HRN0_ARUDO
MCCSFYLWDLVLIEFSTFLCAVVTICEICFCLYFFLSLLYLALVSYFHMDISFGLLTPIFY